MLVLDATIGQNGLAQAREFARSVSLNGLILTKLDGTAKGGVVLPIARSLDVPIRFLGTGEGIDDFVPFSAGVFVESLLGWSDGSGDE